jgi:hypothetical protein
MKYLKIIGINRIFFNFVTFSVTNKSIYSTKKKIDSFLHSYLIFQEVMTISSC